MNAEYTANYLPGEAFSKHVKNEVIFSSHRYTYRHF